ncbi:MAG: hypothetical protein HKP61_13700 [Dactylosporangium sp.]|nr:hypothetical protein [Dactylosporangium sp.]NNJ61968.1 hypothetical protein [Dactylosporangium sp.]
MLVLGEVQTAMLMHAEAASPPLAEQVLALVCGERVRTSHRPIGYAASPETYTGVDCPIPLRSGGTLRGVGTLAGRGTLTGGRVLQGSVTARITRSPDGRRRPWSHYLSHPGVVETIGRVDPAGIAEAHLLTEPASSTLEMGAVCRRLLVRVQQSPHLNQKSPFVAHRTTLRWAAETGTGPDDERVRFTVEDDGVRTLRLVIGAAEACDVIAVCEDVALHDWLLTVLLATVERSRIGAGEPAGVVDRLRPAVDHILHLWMPAARLNRDVMGVWERLERRPGLSRQWDNEVRRVRDQIATAAVLLNLRRAGEGGVATLDGSR